MRKYMAKGDDGHDYFEFYFFSEHRANSRANIEDAIEHYNRHYARRSINIVNTYLIRG